MKAKAAFLDFHELTILICLSHKLECHKGQKLSPQLGFTCVSRSRFCKQTQKRAKAMFDHLLRRLATAIWQTSAAQTCIVNGDMTVCSPREASFGANNFFFALLQNPYGPQFSFHAYFLNVFKTFFSLNYYFIYLLMYLFIYLFIY